MDHRLNHLKRLHNSIQYTSTEEEEEEEEEEERLEFSLSLPPPTTRPPPQQNPNLFLSSQSMMYHNAPQRSRRTGCAASRSGGGGCGEEETITPPFAWATDRPATVHPLSYLLTNNIHTISGEVQCKRCDARRYIHYDLRSKFMEIGSFIVKNMESFNQRAPKQWMNPTLPDCIECNQTDCMKPVIVPAEKSSINWLFLLLGALLGCCTLEQLKYFCMHNKQHRTGAKDRVLFAAYVVLCKQLDPDGPFIVRN